MNANRRLANKYCIGQAADDKRQAHLLRRRAAGEARVDKKEHRRPRPA